MSYNEYLRDKKRAMPQIMSPTRIDTAGLFTQMKRYKTAAPLGAAESDGLSVQHSSSNNVLATLGNAAACCGPVQDTTTMEGCCIEKLNPYPWNGYRPPRQHCCPVRNPPLGGGSCNCK